MVDDGSTTFDALDDSDESVVGPPGVLLCGFGLDEAGVIELLLRDLGLSGHRLVLCTTTMGDWTVAEALAGNDGGRPLPAGKVPRIVLLSGTTDGQVNRLLDRYVTTGLPRPIFAVATAMNLGFRVVELMQDLLAEREAID